MIKSGSTLGTPLKSTPSYLRGCPSVIAGEDAVERTPPEPEPEPERGFMANAICTHTLGTAEP